jgi:hypothetical protein
VKDQDEKKRNQVREATKSHKMMLLQVLWLGLLISWKGLPNRKTRRRRRKN